MALKILSYFGILVLVYCSSYEKKIAETEANYYQKQFDAAIPMMRELTQDSSAKDRLLYLMEAGVLFHTKGDYKTSKTIFKDAADIADTINTSVLKTGLSFVLSDNESNFKGESFERVMIKTYVGLNSVMLGDMDAAKQNFRKVENELKDMKFSESSYKQNIFSRYMNAIISEQTKDFNGARVQYKNIAEITDPNEIMDDRYILAVRENDKGDMNKYANGKNSISAFDKNLKPIEWNPDLAEVVIINQAGKAAVKSLRGTIGEDPVLNLALRAAIDVALHSNNAQAGMSVASVLAMVTTADNPIPIYKERDPISAQSGKIMINGAELGALNIYDNYSSTAMGNFNEQYDTIVAKNVASIATKIVVASVAAYAAGEAAKKAGKDRGAGGQIAGEIAASASGFAGGAAVAATIKPDLRCWHLIPSNLQVKRIYLEPGTYDFNLSTVAKATFTSQNTSKVAVEKGKPLFINYRSF